MSLRELRAAIQQLPGLTVKPWRDGDPRCHCSHCDICGDIFSTELIAAHVDECSTAVLKAVRAARMTTDTMTPIELLVWLTTFASNQPRDMICGHSHQRNGADLAAYWAGCAVFALRGAGEPEPEQVNALRDEARARSKEGEKP